MANRTVAAAKRPPTGRRWGSRRFRLWASSSGSAVLEERKGPAEARRSNTAARRKITATRPPTSDTASPLCTAIGRVTYSPQRKKPMTRASATHSVTRAVLASRRSCTVRPTCGLRSRHTTADARREGRHSVSRSKRLRSVRAGTIARTTRWFAGSFRRCLRSAPTWLGPARVEASPDTSCGPRRIGPLLSPMRFDERSILLRRVAPSLVSPGSRSTYRRGG